MKMTLATLGNWRELVQKDAEIFTRSLFGATVRFGEGAKNAVRADVKASGIRRAGAIANTWRGKGFATSRGGDEKPAYVLGSNMLKVAEQFETGGDISFKGKGLIPTKAGLRLMRELARGAPRTAWIAKAREKFGDRLVMHNFKGRTHWGYWENTKSGKAKFVSLGVLVSRVRGKKLFNHSSILRRAATRFPTEVATDTMEQYEREFGKAEARARFGSTQVIS